jgi:hypothetical protein
MYVCLCVPTCIPTLHEMDNIHSLWDVVSSPPQTCGSSTKFVDDDTISKSHNPWFIPAHCVKGPQEKQHLLHVGVNEGHFTLGHSHKLICGHGRVYERSHIK